MKTAPSSESSANCPSSCGVRGAVGPALSSGGLPALGVWGRSCPCPSCVTCCAPVCPSMPSPTCTGIYHGSHGAWWRPPRHVRAAVSSPAVGPVPLGCLSSPGPRPSQGHCRTLRGAQRQWLWGWSSHSLWAFIRSQGREHTEAPARASSRTWRSLGSAWWRLSVISCHIPECSCASPGARWPWFQVPSFLLSSLCSTASPH